MWNPTWNENTVQGHIEYTHKLLERFCIVLYSKIAISLYYMSLETKQLEISNHRMILNCFPQGCLLSAERQSKHSNCGRCNREEKTEILLHHVRIKLSFCNYYVNCNCKQDTYCHCFKHNTKNCFWFNDSCLKEKHCERSYIWAGSR